MKENEVKEKLSAALNYCPYVFQLGCLKALDHTLESATKNKWMTDAYIESASKKLFTEIWVKVYEFCMATKSEIPLIIADDKINNISWQCPTLTITNVETRVEKIIEWIDTCKLLFCTLLPEWVNAHRNIDQSFRDGYIFEFNNFVLVYRQYKADNLPTEKLMIILWLKIYLNSCLCYHPSNAADTEFLAAEKMLYHLRSRFDIGLDYNYLLK